MYISLSLFFSPDYVQKRPETKKPVFGTFICINRTTTPKKLLFFVVGKIHVVVHFLYVVEIFERVEHIREYANFILG